MLVMIFRRFWALPLLALCSLAFFSSALQAVDDDAFDDRYRLGTGDVISIIVFGEPDLTFGDIRLTERGTVPFPFLGEVTAKGRTVAELEALIATGLRGGYLVDPRVTISLREYRPVYVSGEVKSPGGYAYVPGLTVSKAIVLAGGMTDRGSQRKMVIIRDGQSTTEPEKATMDSRLNPGDTLKIEESFF
jgi:polysaccharide export outer membrane protein